MALQALGAGDPAVRDEPKPETRIQLWHNFSDEALDADAIAGWSLAVPKLMNRVADELVIGERPEADSVGGRIGKLFLIAPLGILEAAIGGASHEYGHFRAYSRSGFQDFKFVRATGDDTLDGNPFSAFAVMVNQNVLGGTDYAAIAGDFDPAKLGTFAREFDLLGEAGGFNQQQYNAEILSAELHDGPVHFLGALPYFSNLLGTMFYPNGSTSENSDIGDARSTLRDLGVEVSTGDIRWRTQLPKLAGNTAISFFLAVADYVATGDVRTELLKLDSGDFRIYWPDFASYLTLFGPTIKASHRVGRKDYLWTFSYETATAANQGEAGAGWEGVITGRFSGEAYFVYNPGSGWWLEGGPSIRLNAGLSVGFKFYHGSGYTFRREVAGLEPDFLENSEGGTKAFVEFGF